MKEFFDTSVLVAAFRGGHPQHEACLKLVSEAKRQKSACAAHSMAEVYATMTALPVKVAIAPEQALLFVQEVRHRFRVIELTSDEYFATIAGAAEAGLTSGRIYDALLLACASKAKAESIYTLNLKHFRSIRPDLAERIQAPV